MSAVAESVSAGLMAERQGLPTDWRADVARVWQQAYDAAAGSDTARTFAAERALADIEARINAAPLPLTADDEAIRAKATKRAEACRQVIRRYAGDPAELGAQTEAGAVARLHDEHWWRRQLRRRHGRYLETAGIYAGRVRADRQPYVTDENVQRRRSQRGRNQALLEACLAVNEAGDEYTLAELAELGVSNPALRRSELMTRIAGMEWVANAEGWVGYFLTFTTPSAYHPTAKRGDGRTVANPRWEGWTPRDGQRWLSRMWQRLRAAWKRYGVAVYGIRVAEPHADGTPHWHVLVWVEPGRARRMLSLARRYALAEYADEPGARVARFKALKMDSNKARSAAGYVAKYVAKNIDGAHLAPDDPKAGDMMGRDPGHLAERVTTWASVWSIRQFQFIGSPSVTAWRELRRLDAEADGVLELARAAADYGQWGQFMRLCRRFPDCEPRPLWSQPLDPDTGEYYGGGEPLNRYGEPAAPSVIGVEAPAHGVQELTRWHVWTIYPPTQRSATNDDSNRNGDSSLADPGRGGADSAVRPGPQGMGDQGRKGSSEASEGACRTMVFREGDMAPEMAVSDRSPGQSGGDGQRRDLATAAGRQAGGPWSPVNNCTRRPYELAWRGLVGHAQPPDPGALRRIMTIPPGWYWRSKRREPPCKS